MATEVRYSTGLDGLWRIVALGGLIPSRGPESDPFIRLFLRRLIHQDDGVNDLSLVPALHHVDLPLGETPFLPTGMILNNDVAIAATPKDLQKFEVVLTFKHEHEIVKRAYLPELQDDDRIHRFLTAEDKGRLDELLYLRGETVDGIPIIVPCHEIFRFYYLISSRLGRLITSSEILDPERLHSSRLTEGLDDDGRMHIVVRRGLLPSDVPIVAQWIATGHGLQSAQAIARHIFSQHTVRKLVTIRAMPPFVGDTRWTVLGRMLDGRLLVYEILCCNHPFAYSTLEWRYADDQAPQDMGNKQKSPEGDRKSIGFVKRAEIPFPFVHIKGGVRPEGRFTSWVIPMGDLADRFGGLRVDGIVRVRPQKNADEKPRRKQRKIPANPDDHSARARGSDGLDGRQQVELAASNPKISGQGNADDDEPFSELRYALAMCRSIQDSGYQWNDRIDDREHYLFEERMFNLLPQNIVGSKKRFVFLDDAYEHVRPAYIAEFEYWGMFGYLLEIAMRDSGDQFCTLLFRTDDHTKLPPQALEHILQYCAERGRAAISQTTRDAWHLYDHRFLHLKDKKKTSEERAQDVIAILRM